GVRGCGKAVQLGVSTEQQSALTAKSIGSGNLPAGGIQRRVGDLSGSLMGVIGDDNGTGRPAGGTTFSVKDRVFAANGRDDLANVVTVTAVVGDRAVIIIVAIAVSVSEVEQRTRRCRYQGERERRSSGVPGRIGLARAQRVCSV